jgi:hypothetical protein
MALCSSRRSAIPAQQFCSITIGENLIVRDGNSKTAMWKK